jgi:hypothetical protein
MCCPQYSQGNRRRKHVVYGMALEAMDRPWPTALHKTRQGAGIQYKLDVRRLAAEMRRLRWMFEDE